MTTKQTRRDKPYRSHTFEAWPCCGGEVEEHGGRLKSRVICGECADLMKLGKAAKTQAAADRVSGARQPFWFHEVDYAYPYIAGPARHGNDYARDLMSALYALVWLVGEPADGQPMESPIQVKTKTRRRSSSWPTSEPEFEPWPEVIDNPEVSKGHQRDWRKLVMLRPIVRNAINALDQVIRRAVGEAYQQGKSRGASVLFQLASGETSLDDFDLALMTPEQRAAAKARR